MMVFDAMSKFQTITNKVTRMLTLLQANQRAHRKLMPFDTHHLGQGTQQ
jgi:hypothetical protein